MEGNAGQGNTRSLGDHGVWGLLGRPPERACEQCGGPGHRVAVRVGAAGGLCRPGSAAIHASLSPKRFQPSNAFHQVRVARQACRARDQLKAFAAERGLKVAAWYIENESGAKLARQELFRLRAIAARLNERGIPTAGGEGEWSAPQVQRVLHRLQ
jgi:hypothetical protein